MTNWLSLVVISCIQVSTGCNPTWSQLVSVGHSQSRPIAIDTNEVYTEYIIAKEKHEGLFKKVMKGVEPKGYSVRVAACGQGTREVS